MTSKHYVATLRCDSAENAPTDVESVKVEVVEQPTVRKIPSQLSLF